MSSKPLAPNWDPDRGPIVLKGLTDTPENREWLAKTEVHTGTEPFVHPACGTAHWITGACPEQLGGSHG